MKRIVILGESHVRSFSYRKNLLPFFMGSGRDVNLDNAKLVIKKANKIIENTKDEDSLYFFYLGEPNVRYQLKNDWDVHKTGFKDQVLNKEYLQKCISKYKNILSKVKVDGIISPTTAYIPSLKALKYFNSELEKMCKELNISFINVYKSTINDKGNVRNKLKDPNYKRDPIHLNSQISDIFLNELLNHGFISDIKNYKSSRDSFNSRDIMNNFSVSKFGSLTFK